MLKYCYVLFVMGLITLSTSTKAKGWTSCYEFTPIDTLITQDTTAISEHILVVRQIIHFNEVILEDTVKVGNTLQIKKIIVEHTAISPIDTLYLGNKQRIENELVESQIVAALETAPLSVEKTTKQLQPDNKKESIVEPAIATSPYSSNSYFDSLRALEAAEAEAKRKPTKPTKETDNKKFEATPISRAGLPGAKVLERRSITPKEAYNLTLAEIEKKRQYYARELQKATNESQRQIVIKRASEYLEEMIAVDVVHYWYGTTFDKEGMAKNPNEGKIACSYFITTILEDAGLKVNRVKLAQQSAENITKTLCSSDKMQRFTAPIEVKNYVEEKGKGLYIIGFSFHVGFLYNDGLETYLIHASPLPPGTVARLPIVGARSFDYSNFYDIGKLSDNTDLMLKWMKGEKIY
ncbi:MAG: hypothetical protein R3E32_12290 [Chitinophagales bacterium]